MAGYDGWMQDSYERELYRQKMRMMRRRREQRRNRKITAITRFLLLMLSVTAIILIFTRHYTNLHTDRQQQAKEALSGSQKPGTVSTGAGQGTIPREGEQLEDSTVKIGSVGDVIMHLQVIEAYGGLEATDAHDFKPALETFRTAYDSVDYMVANLETSLGGPDKPFSGFPNFNSPDEITSDLLEMGVDLQLLANNHIYDNGKDGFIRTLSVLDQRGITYTGARNGEDRPRFLIQELNGIRIGIINYTYEMESGTKGKSVNGNVMDKSVANYLNTFKVSKIEDFYAELEAELQNMRSQGAEFILVYMHWGNEYELTQNKTQEEIAAKLCDMGVDAVIGGHPHVVQPIKVLTSSDGSHKMLCAYSLGNHFSNQRRDQISSRPNGHTEDGLMLNLTISRVGGQVSISNVEAVPTYVYKSNVPKYYVIPIYDPASVEEQTGLNGIQAAIQASYERTQKILGNGVEDAKRELGIPID